MNKNTQTKKDKSWFGQPRGLTILFMTETWEKFSFYGMRALLVYYMTKSLKFPPGKVSLIYGLYTAFVYFTPIIGGPIADRWLGRRRSVVIGGGVMAMGHFMLAFQPLFYPGLAAIALGNGLYLPNLPSQIGDLYRPDDPRRGSAFNVYYVGINLGSFFAPLICGYLGERCGWDYGFTAAGIGMCLGLTIYILGSGLLPSEPSRVKAVPDQSKPSESARETVKLLLLIGMAVVLFRGAYEQVGNTIALWADTDVDRQAGGFVVPGSWFQSLNPLLIFMLTPVLVSVWIGASKRGREPSSMTKMAIGAFGLAIAYGVLVLVTLFGQVGSTKISWIWLTVFIFILTCAELYILPVGLGLFARLAPKGRGATTIAAWFFAGFAGNLIAGAFGSFWTSVGHSEFFALMAALALASGTVLYALDRPARALEHAHAAKLQG